MRAFVERDIDRIYNKTLLVGIYLYNKQTKRWYKELKRLKSYTDFVNISPFISNALQKILEKSMLLAYLMGHDSMQKEIKAQVDKYDKKELAETGSQKQTYDIQMGFDEAVRKLKLKKIIPSDEFKNASAHIKATSFSVQKIERFQALGAIKESLINAIDTGMTFKDWKNKEMLYVFAKHGIAPLNPHHLETVFRTNLGSVYEMARNESAMKDPNVEGWERFGIGDSRQSDVCASLDGIKRAKDDPIWDSISPLTHHKCRCTKIPITSGYKKAHNIKWDKNPSQKTLDMVGKDFRGSPKNLNQYSKKVDKRLTEVEKKNTQLNDEIKDKLKPKTEEQLNKEAMEYWRSDPKRDNSMHQYTVWAGFKMNEYLRYGIKPEGIGVANLNKFLDAIVDFKKALIKAPKYKGKVYRIIDMEKEKVEGFLNKIKDEGGFTDKAFISTTIDKSGMDKFQDFINNDKYRRNNTLIKFELDSYNGSYIGKASYYPTLKEVTFNTNSRIKITKIIKEKTGVTSQEKYILKGEIIGGK